MSKNKIGAVAFLDILGYKSFLDENPREEATEKVLEFMNRLDRATVSSSIDETEKQFGLPSDAFGTLIFSDTILITAEVNESSPYKGMGALMGLSARVSHLSRLMFEFGLPLRGAIDFGNYRVEKSSFTGTAIVNAHRIAENINMAGTVISPALWTELCNRAGDKDGVPKVVAKGGLYINYNVPSKTGRQRFNCINFARVASKEEYPTKLETADIRDWVLKSFWAHGKQLNESAEIKAHNTEMFLRYCKIMNAETFK